MAADLFVLVGVIQVIATSAGAGSYPQGIPFENEHLAPQLQQGKCHRIIYTETLISMPWTVKFSPP